MRRIKLLKVNPGVLIMLLRCEALVVSGGLPDDARVVGHEIDAYGDIVLTVESQTYPPVGPADPVPVVAPIRFRKSIDRRR